MCQVLQGVQPIVMLSGLICLNAACNFVQGIRDQALISRYEAVRKPPNNTHEAGMRPVDHEAGKPLTP